MHIVIAIVSIPVVDIQAIIRIEVTNISDIRAALKIYLSVNYYLTMVWLLKPLYFIRSKLLETKKDIRSV